MLTSIPGGSPSKNKHDAAPFLPRRRSSLEHIISPNGCLVNDETKEVTVRVPCDAPLLVSSKDKMMTEDQTKMRQSRSSDKKEGVTSPSCFPLSPSRWQPCVTNTYPLHSDLHTLRRHPHELFCTLSKPRIRECAGQSLNGDFSETTVNPGMNSKWKSTSGSQIRPPSPHVKAALALMQEGSGLSQKVQKLAAAAHKQAPKFLERKRKVSRSASCPTGLHRKDMEAAIRRNHRDNRNSHRREPSRSQSFMRSRGSFSTPTPLETIDESRESNNFSKVRPRSTFNHVPRPLRSVRSCDGSLHESSLMSREERSYVKSSRGASSSHSSKASRRRPSSRTHSEPTLDFRLAR